MYHMLIIEWDGKKPPTTFYNRLKSLGLRVGRGADKSDEPLARRVKLAETDVYPTTGKNGKTKSAINRDANNVGWDFNSVIIQEGLILTVSEQLANTIAGYAVEHGARNVMMMTGEPQNMIVGVQDAQVMKRLEEKLGRRGRPSSTITMEWTITCREEGLSFTVQTDKIVTCPNCKSTRILTLPGGLSPVKASSATSVYETWRRVRFTRGVFEVAPVDDATGTEIATDTAIDAQNESLTTRLIQSSAGLLRDVETIARELGRDVALRALDLVFLGRTYTGTNTRTDGRVRAVTDLLMKGVPSSEVSIIEHSTDLDLLDGAYQEPSQTAGIWMIARRGRSK